MLAPGAAPVLLSVSLQLFSGDSLVDGKGEGAAGSPEFILSLSPSFAVAVISCASAPCWRSFSGGVESGVSVVGFALGCEFVRLLLLGVSLLGSV